MQETKGKQDEEQYLGLDHFALWCTPISLLGSAPTYSEWPGHRTLSLSGPSKTDSSNCTRCTAPARWSSRSARWPGSWRGWSAAMAEHWNLGVAAVQIAGAFAHCGTRL